MTDLDEFLNLLSNRMGMIKRGAEPDVLRAAQYFVKWWREDGGLVAPSTALQLADLDALLREDPSATITQGWGFDFEWQLQSEDISAGKDSSRVVQEKMEKCIEEYLLQAEHEAADENISSTQKKKRAVVEEKAKRKAKYSR
jgi:hypothetical protein